MENEEIVLNFMQFTGVDDLGVAHNFCETNGWNLQASIESYFANPNLFSAGVSAANEAPFEEEPVREAIPAQFATLAGNNMNMGRMAVAQPAAEPFRNYGAEWTRNGKNQDSRGLAQLFSPPSYVFQGSLAEACEAGMMQSKWILINIQATDEFASHVLNRDCWKDNTPLSGIIKEHFIFCQRDKESQFGRVYSQRYHNYGPYPIVAIIDPITRAHLQKVPLSHQPTSQEIMPCLLTFMELHKKPGIEEQIDDDHSEDFDEETKKALAMSLEMNNTSEIKPTAIEKEPVTTQPEPVVEPQIQKTYNFGPPSPEPPKDKTSTTLRIKLPNGNSVQRRFLKEDQIKEIYSVLEHDHEMDFGDLTKFVLKITFPKKTLGADLLGNSLASEQIMNCRLILDSL